MMLLALAAALLAQDLPGAKPFEKPAVKVAAVRVEKAGELHKASFDLEIPPKWHVYPVRKPLFGTPTVFSFEGAEIAGPIAEPEPKVHEDKKLGLKYDYHEGKVTIVVPLRVKSPELKGKIDYQICDPSTCVQNSTPFAFKVEGATQDSDDPPPLRILSIKPDREAVKAGEPFKVAFAVEVPATWHIYPTYKTGTGLPTEFKFAALAAAGTPEEPKAKTHPAKGADPAYDYHEGAVTFTVPFTLKPGPKPGPLEVKGQIDYMICRFEGTCVNTDVPAAFSVTVLEGQVASPAAAGAGPGESFLVMLGFAFLGGWILNIMPCVLPVLTLKLFSLVNQKTITDGQRKAAALAYTGGALACLEILAVVVVVLRSFGKLVGWGFQFQEPVFVLVLATLIFVFALSLLGVFQIPALGTGAAAKAGRQHGWSGHLMTGFFVTVVATPCSAPMLGSALGYALTLPPLLILLFFAVVGLGLASPFLLIGFVPSLLRVLPKPGPWLEVFEKIMGFVFLGTAVWLIDTFGSLTGQAGMTGILAFLIAVALGCWILGKWGSEVASGRARLVSLAAAVLISAAAGRQFLVTKIEETKPVAGAGIRIEGLSFDGKIPWQPFSDENVAAVRAARKPGFIDFTADW
jgi:cytochrome c biogenesis protein CcdA